MTASSVRTGVRDVRVVPRRWACAADFDAVQQPCTSMHTRVVGCAARPERSSSLASHGSQGRLLAKRLDMRRSCLSFVVVSLVACAPADCTPAAPAKLAAISGLTFVARTNGIILSVNDSCPVFDFTGVTAEFGGVPLSAAGASGPQWTPQGVLATGKTSRGTGAFSGERCDCIPGFLSAEPAPVASRRFDLKVTQGSTVIQARYTDVSNSVRVVERTPATSKVRKFQFLSAFDRIYTIVPGSLGSDPPSSRITKIVAANGGVPVDSISTSTASELSIEFSGPVDELTFEVNSLSHDIEPSECEGPVTCGRLRVTSPARSVSL